MSLNVFYDSAGDDIWGGVFGLVWGGVILVEPQPDRVYLSLGLYRTIHVGLGVTRQITIGVER